MCVCVFACGKAVSRKQICTVAASFRYHRVKKRQIKQHNPTQKASLAGQKVAHYGWFQSGCTWDRLRRRPSNVLNSTSDHNTSSISGVRLCPSRSIFVPSLMRCKRLCSFKITPIVLCRPRNMYVIIDGTE